MANLTNKQLLRALLKELKHATYGKPMREHLMYPVIAQEFRGAQVTENRYCRAENETRHLAQSYLSLLQGVRNYQEISERYRSRERTTQEAAHIVGLEIPQQADPPK